MTDCENLVTELGSYKTALDNLASALSSIKTDLQGIRDQATAGGTDAQRGDRGRAGELLPSWSESRQLCGGL